MGKHEFTAFNLTMKLISQQSSTKVHDTICILWIYGNVIDSPFTFTYFPSSKFNFPWKGSHQKNPKGLKSLAFCNSPLGLIF